MRTSWSRGGSLLLTPLLLLAGPAGAAVFTVGTGGTYDTVQLAVNAAIAAGGVNEVRVRAGSYVQRVKVGPPVPNLASGSLTLTGGWDAAFASRDPDPLSTVLDGGGTGPVADLRPAGGTLVLEGFTLTNGHGQLFGGGIMVGQAGISVTSTVVVQNNRIEGNSASDGGGIYAAGEGTPSIIIADNVIRLNHSLAVGGGLSVRALGESTFSVVRNLVEQNEIQTSAGSAGSTSGAGVFLKLQERPFVDFSDNVVRDNVATGTGGNLGDGAAMWAFRGCNNPPIPIPLDCTNGTIEARRNVFLDNRNESADPAVYHLSLISELDATVRVTDSIVARGGGAAVAYFARDGGAVELTNLTVVDHPGAGITERVNTGSASIANTIAFDNTPDLTAPLAVTEVNLVGVDPAFVDPAADYRLQEGSPAIDAGSDTPPGGLGPFDVAGQPRVVGGSVDIGAFEFVPEPGATLQGAAAGLVLLAAARRRRARRPAA